MLLRDHPLMMYRRRPNWPPVWFCTDGYDQHPQGEVGTPSRRFCGLICNRLIVVFYLFAMRTQSISAVYYSMIRCSVVK
jgi:hypothetical protein